LPGNLLRPCDSLLTGAVRASCITGLHRNHISHRSNCARNTTVR